MTEKSVAAQPAMAHKNDADMQHDVQDELRWDPSIRAEQIGVTVSNGVVKLDGRVDSLWDKYAAERAALRCAKVKSVVLPAKTGQPT
jgi:osmotically-inducible protein OsmY